MGFLSLLSLVEHRSEALWYWLRRTDSNCRSEGYEPPGLPLSHSAIFVASRLGLEPRTLVLETNVVANYTSEILFTKILLNYDAKTVGKQNRHISYEAPG